MFEKQWSQIVAKAWVDANFKKRLMADPAAVLGENGIDALKGFRVKVVENTDQVVHLTLPRKPSEPLSEAELANVAGGYINAYNAAK